MIDGDPVQPRFESLFFLKFVKVLKSLDENILWYPQAGSCFDYLYLFADENNKFDVKPSLHIHTDFLPNKKIYDLPGVGFTA